MFINRDDAGRQLAERLQDRPLVEPVVMAIPRGGVVVGAALAAELGTELDVVLSSKLRAPLQPELAIGAISENGEVFLNAYAADAAAIDDQWLHRERQVQLDKIASRKKLFRGVRPLAEVAGRSVIVTDDGIATGATMIAALQLLRQSQPHELIVAVPVAPPDRLHEVRGLCDCVVCLLTPVSFYGVGQFYEEFPAVEDDEAVELLRKRYLQHQRTKSDPTAARSEHD